MKFQPEISTFGKITQVGSNNPEKNSRNGDKLEAEEGEPRDFHRLVKGVAGFEES